MKTPFLSLRALCQQGVAIHTNNTQSLESTFGNNANKTQSKQRAASLENEDLGIKHKFSHLRASETSVATRSFFSNP
ncbi:hypothetical protein [Helicobacter zhangjianzhongii]|uniref:Uncharacterized protein n=1 Tax=Helicobacter zhangjianzhongii TaxID=2974574 RepID=A0ACC6FRT3_9HELI|nr:MULTISPECIES: hypothetical protein [unclassified Helicobacter]MDL0080010.1 hypothetical protein [Helicobacter sp. CPD2-1]MDL0081797.1 hypothetical protein [Helicobacter sp. XJK30-2]